MGVSVNVDTPISSVLCGNEDVIEKDVLTQTEGVAVFDLPSSDDATSVPIYIPGGLPKFVCIQSLHLRIPPRVLHLSFFLGAVFTYSMRHGKVSVPFVFPQKHGNKMALKSGIKMDEVTVSKRC